MCFSKKDITLYDDLSRPLELNNVDTSLWSEKCDYVDPSNCANLNPDNYNLVVLQVNVRSQPSHQSELWSILHLLANRNSTVNILILCETFLLSKSEQLVNIPGYSWITNNRKNHKGGGAILIRDGITYKCQFDLAIMHEKEVEGIYAKIRAKNGKNFVIGSLYRAPNTCKETLIQYMEETVNKLNSEKENKELILGMDQNVNLLKSERHKATGKFLDTILSLKLWPVITRPTRITQQSATLIDNIYISYNLQHSFDLLMSWSENQGIFYISQIFSMNWISFMITQLNAVLVVHWLNMGDRV